MKKLLQGYSDVVILGLLVLALVYLCWDSKLPRMYNDKQHDLLEVEVMPTSTPEPEPTEVRFTSHHIGDYSGSGDTTASGLTVDDFEVNAEGWYTYNGKVVLASATYGCMMATTGACGQYMELPDGYSIHELFDEVVIYLNGTSYTGIILDACGASFWDEPLQRYDIFVVSKDHMTDQSGYILKE